jgi:hypothetical protein
VSVPACLVSAPHSLLPDDPNMSITALGVSHGDLLFMAYDMERQVEPAYKPGPLDSNRPFGSHVSVGCTQGAIHLVLAQ